MQRPLLPRAVSLVLLIWLPACWGDRGAIPGAWELESSVWRRQADPFATFHAFLDTYGRLATQLTSMGNALAPIANAQLEGVSNPTLSWRLQKSSPDGNDTKSLSAWNASTAIPGGREVAVADIPRGRSHAEKTISRRSGAPRKPTAKGGKGLDRRKAVEIKIPPFGIPGLPGLPPIPDLTNLTGNLPSILNATIPKLPIPPISIPKLPIPPISIPKINISNVPPLFVTSSPVVLPPLVLPPVSVLVNTSSLVILAPNRTHRVNPLKDFHFYTGGWDFYSGDYWASLAWDTVYGPIIGIVWVLFGLGFAFFLLCVCLCFPHRWRSLRDGTLKYKPSQLRLPLIFMVLGLILALAGLGLMIAGAVKLHRSVNDMTDFVVGEVNRVTYLVNNVTGLIRAFVADPRIPANFTNFVVSDLVSIINEADSTSVNARRTAAKAQKDIRHATQIIEDILFVLGCVTVGVIILGMVFGLLRWVLASNIMTSLLWIIVLVIWILVTVFIFLWIFGGDTNVALVQVEGTPSDISKFNVIVPCLDPQAVENLQLFSRFVGYASVVVLNATIAQRVPFLFPLIGSPRGLCNPFRGPPDYALDTSLCSGCNAFTGHCTDNSISLIIISQGINGTSCSSAIPGLCDALTATASIGLSAAILVVQVLANGIEKLLPSFGQLLRCAYISHLAQVSAQYVDDMQGEAIMLWCGYLAIAVGAMVVSICLPIYVYRGVRSYDRLKPEVDGEPKLTYNAMGPTESDTSRIEAGSTANSEQHLNPASNYDSAQHESLPQSGVVREHAGATPFPSGGHSQGGNSSQRLGPYQYGSEDGNSGISSSGAAPQYGELPKWSKGS